MYPGKRWVECRNKGQISLPDNIDPETQVDRQIDMKWTDRQIENRQINRQNIYRQTGRLIEWFICSTRQKKIDLQTSRKVIGW